MKILDRLDRLERGATPGPWKYDDGVYHSGYEPPTQEHPPCLITPIYSVDVDVIRDTDGQLITELRNHAWELIEVARAAEIACRISSTSNMLALKEALERLEK